MAVITVDELLEKPFSERTLKEKMKIVSDQKPRPTFPTPGFEGEFNKIFYDNINWLTASDKRKSFFCWPCLLMISPIKWNSGIDDLRYVLDHYKQHEEEPEHLEAVHHLQLFILNNFKNPSNILHPESKKSLSELDHYVLIQLIDKICSDIKEACLDGFNFNMIKLYQFSSFLNSQPLISAYTIAKVEENPEIMNGLVDAISIVLKAAIQSEVKKSTYATVILSEHILNKEESQISTVLRYLKNGEIHERFIGFTNSVGTRMQHKDIAEHFFKVKKAYHIRGSNVRVPALSVDGAVLSCQELSKLFDLDTFKCNYFIPSHCHELGRVLIQSVTHFEECELFFKTIRVLESYFVKENNLVRFEGMLTSEFLPLRKKKMYFACPFLVFLDFYRSYIIAFFEYEQTLLKYESPEDLAQAKAFKDFLGNFKTIFLLKVFVSIFEEHFDKNLNFKPKLYSINFNKELAGFQSNIQKLQADGFTALWVEANLEQMGKEAEQSGKLKEFENPKKESYSKLFEKILDQISMEINFRLKDIPRLAFCALLNCNNLGFLDFKEKLVKLLLFELKSHFDESILSSEILFLKEDCDCSEQFHNKSIYDIMVIFKKPEFYELFPQLYKLGEFILTMPFLPPSKDIKTTKLKQIENFSYVPEAAGSKSGDASILCIESELLLELKSRKDFYEDVIQKYCEMKGNGIFHQGYFP